nr:hypothetical protein [Deltaproteobacteria bacterium]
MASLAIPTPLRALRVSTPPTTTPPSHGRIPMICSACRAGASAASWAMRSRATRSRETRTRSSRVSVSA